MEKTRNVKLQEKLDARNEFIVYTQMLYARCSYGTRRKRTIFCFQNGSKDFHEM